MKLRQGKCKPKEIILLNKKHIIKLIMKKTNGEDR